MEHFVREIFRTGGYVYAAGAAEIAERFGHSRIARLASNENPNPPSPGAIQSAIAELNECNRYPQTGQDRLVASLCRHYGAFDFVTGVGMDGIIETTIRTLIEPGNLVAILTPTFSFYELAAQAQGARVRRIPRRADFTTDVELLVRESRDAGLVFLCSPNNPTGTSTTPDEIATILASIDGVLFLDNAYVEFSPHDYLPLLKDYENLIIGRTFSKAYSLAGLRIGYAFVPRWFRDPYLRASTPHTLNRVSAAAAAGAIEDQDHVRRYVTQVAEWRERLMAQCPYPVIPSDANFVMIDTRPLTSVEMVGRLSERGILVRSCTSFPGLPSHYIRVSIGEDWEMNRFLEGIRTL